MSLTWWWMYINHDSNFQMWTIKRQEWQIPDKDTYNHIDGHNNDNDCVSVWSEIIADLEPKSDRRELYDEVFKESEESEKERQETRRMNDDKNNEESFQGKYDDSSCVNSTIVISEDEITLLDESNEDNYNWRLLLDKSTCIINN